MSVRIIIGDCRDALRSLPDQSVHCAVTSPPYFGLRDYGVAGQIGLEPTPEAFVVEMVAVFRDVRRVLRDDGTLWLNLGDSYAGSGRGGNPTEETSGLQGGQASQRASMVARSRPLPSGLKQKDLMGMPWMVAFALRADGWYLRQDIVWSKPNPMPESVSDRCTKAHEYLFLLSKSASYFYDIDAIREPLAESSIQRLSQDIEAQHGSERVPGKTNGTMKAVSAGDRRPSRSSEDFRGRDLRNKDMERFGTTRGRTNQSCTHPKGRNKRSVWEVTTQPFSLAHFATFPPALIEPCIKAGCPEGGTVLDPFGGAGTTGLVADRLRRNAILIELNPAYAEMAARRIDGEAGMLSDVSTETLPTSEAVTA